MADNQTNTGFILVCDCGCAEFLVEKYFSYVYCAACFSTWIRKDNRVTQSEIQNDFDQKTQYFLLDTLERQTLYTDVDSDNPSVIDIMDMV